MDDLNKSVLIDKVKLVLKPSVPLFVFSVVLKGEEPCIGRNLIQMTLPGNTIIGCIIRANGAMVVPSGTDVLSAGDKLYILTAPGQQDLVLKALKE